MAIPALPLDSTQRNKVSTQQYPPRRILKSRAIISDFRKSSQLSKEGRHRKQKDDTARTQSYGPVFFTPVILGWASTDTDLPLTGDQLAWRIPAEQAAVQPSSGQTGGRLPLK